MKKIGTFLFFAMVVPMIVMAQISFDEVNAEGWVGVGTNEAMFVVDFDADPIGTDSAFAWGVRFDDDYITGDEILTLIAQSNENFIWSSGGGFLNNISYNSNNQNYTNPNLGWFSILESPDGENWVWNSGIGDSVGDGQWFGIVVMNPDTYEAEINVPLIQTAISKSYIAAVKIYPNPATDFLSVNLADVSGIVMTNMSGQVVFRSDSKIELIDVSEFEPGLYTISIFKSDVRITKKIMVK
jgi:hypothetical protein